MARALRIEIQGGHYHVTARGNERRAIFRQDKDRTHFLELLSELPPRFGVRLQEIFSKRHRDWGRDAVLWLGRYAGRMGLAELAALVGNCDYTTVGKAVRRFQLRASMDPALGRVLQALKNEFSCFEM